MPDFGKAYGSLPFGAGLYLVGDDVTSEALLDKLRGAFSGKALYLDFRATWCAPCLGEMPYSTKLHGAAEGLPLEFVYLCTDSGGSEEKWRNIIASHQVGGTHIYVPKKAHSELMKLFNGRCFLTYVLLQADGTGKLDVARPLGLDRQTLEALLK
ncbi:MAG: TlpA disulfide reductase family protein [Lewinella sp.]|nr:TlpA disulfide reductase family protein [Lewinella sp.]